MFFPNYKSLERANKVKKKKNYSARLKFTNFGAICEGDKLMVPWLVSASSWTQAEQHIPFLIGGCSRFIMCLF